MHRPTPARVYAAEIAALPVAERESAYGRVPPELIDRVRFYVTEYFPNLELFAVHARRAREAREQRELRHAR